MRHSLGCERFSKKGSASCAGTLQGTKQLLLPQDINISAHDSRSTRMGKAARGRSQVDT